jgi:rhodanese-related sulfurtransferase
MHGIRRKRDHTTVPSALSSEYNDSFGVTIRNPDEFKEAHIKGAKNFPLSELSQHIDKLKTYDHIYIHCKRGGRAQNAFQFLAGSG